MAHYYGGASEYIRANYRLRRNFSFLYLAVIFIVMPAVLIYNYQIVLNSNIVGAIIIVTFYSFSIWFCYKEFKKLDKVARQFFRGGRAEGAIWYELRKLNDNFTIFQDFKIPELGNIDCVLTGPNGVFVIEVKSHKGNIGFNGQQLTRDGYLFEKDFLGQSMRETLYLHDYLKKVLEEEIFVQPVLVFASKDSTMHFGLGQVKNVTVVQRRLLRKIIESRPRIYRKPTILRIDAELKKLLVKPLRP